MNSPTIKERLEIGQRVGAVIKDGGFVLTEDLGLLVEPHYKDVHLAEYELCQWLHKFAGLKSALRSEQARGKMDEAFSSFGRGFDNLHSALRLTEEFAGSELYAMEKDWRDRDTLRSVNATEP